MVHRRPLLVGAVVGISPGRGTNQGPRMHSFKPVSTSIRGGAAAGSIKQMAEQHVGAPKRCVGI